jgi:hypothetical protein
MPLPLELAGRHQASRDVDADGRVAVLGRVLRFDLVGLWPMAPDGGWLCWGALAGRLGSPARCGPEDVRVVPQGPG